MELYALNNSVRDTFEAGLEKIVRHTAEAASAGYRFLFERGYPVLHNSEEQTLFAADVAREIVGSEHVDARMQPVMGAEDFAFMLRKIHGCYVFLGSGRQDEATPRQLHNSHYDFNDNVMPNGVRYWVTLAERYLLKHPPKKARSVRACLTAWVSCISVFGTAALNEDQNRLHEETVRLA